ncbi:MAG: prepilin-type N-terminal cleavage/methylation domain-containing protein [Gemmatimonadota bacterium]
MSRHRLGRAGFSLPELFSAMVMVGILAAIAVPRLRGPIGRADAAKVLSDFNSIRHAAYEVLEDKGRFPLSGTPGVVPAEMAGAVPEFQYKGLTYTWTAVDLRSTPGGVFGGRALGLLMVTFNGKLDVADALQGHEAKPIAGGVLFDYYWTPTQALFLILE